MCVILKKNAGSEIPFEHLLAAAHRNNHGYGVAVDANGKLERFGGIEEHNPEKAAKEVQRILGDAKNELAFVHFRLRTRGSIDEQNVQPIPILSKDEGDEFDMVFMHNGTISSIKGSFSDGPSDSVVFANEIVGPLIRRSAAFLGARNVLSDPLIPMICESYGDWSKFALFDSFGNHLIINEKSGEDQPYGWASNGYSLLSSNYKKEEKKAESKIYTGFVPPTRPKDSLTKDLSGLTKKMNDNIQTPQDTLRTPPYQRETISSGTGFSLEDFHFLSEIEIEDLVVDHPRLAGILILDLIEFHYSKTTGAE